MSEECQFKGVISIFIFRGIIAIILLKNMLIFGLLSYPASGCPRPLSKGNRGCRIEPRMGRDRRARGVSPEKASPILWRSASRDGATSQPARRGVMSPRRGLPEGREPRRGGWSRG